MCVCGRFKSFYPHSEPFHMAKRTFWPRQQWRAGHPSCSCSFRLSTKLVADSTLRTLANSTPELRKRTEFEPATDATSATTTTHPRPCTVNLDASTGCSFETLLLSHEIRLVGRPTTTTRYKTRAQKTLTALTCKIKVEKSKCQSS